MSRRMLLITSLILIALWIMAFTSPHQTSKQIRKYFEMPAYVGTVPEHVQSAITAKLPLGTSWPIVHEYLISRGIGNDGRSVCTTPERANLLTCTIPASHHVWELIRETNEIRFEFDSNHRLRDVRVTYRITGP